MTISDLQSLLNLSWVLLCAGMALVMQAGFSCRETGLVHAKNSINVAIKNVVDFCVAALIYWWFGFALMFGASAWGLFGTNHFLFSDVAQPSLLAFFVCQLVIFGTATTINGLNDCRRAISFCRKDDLISARLCSCWR